MTRFFCAFAAVAAVLMAGSLAPAPVADAGGCRVVQQQVVVRQAPVVVQQAAYVAPAYVAPTYAVPVLAIPVYSAGYVGDAASARELSETRETLREALRVLRQQPAAQAPVPQAIPQQLPKGEALPPADDDAVSLFHTKCAACHDATTAKAKGDGVVLTANGAILDLDCYSISTVLFEVLEGKMPKKGAKLSGPELRTVSRWAQAAQTKLRDREKKQPAVEPPLGALGVNDPYQLVLKR